MVVSCNVLQVLLTFLTCYSVKTRISQILTKPNRKGAVLLFLEKFAYTELEVVSQGLSVKFQLNKKVLRKNNSKKS